MVMMMICWVPSYDIQIADCVLRILLQHFENQYCSSGTLWGSPPPPPTPPYSTQTDSGRTGPAPDSWGQAGPVLRETAGHTERTWGRWGHEDVRRWGRKECPRVSVWGLLSPPLLAAEVAALWWPPPATNTHCILCPQTHGHTHTSTSYNCSQLPEKLSRLYL